MEVDEVRPYTGRTLVRMGARLCLADDAAVVSWQAHDPAIPHLVRPAQGSGIVLERVAPRQVGGGPTARTVVDAPCGVVEVLDALVVAAEPVGRAAPGVALVRLLRCTDGPLDLEQVARIGGKADRVRWTSLNRIAFGHLAGRKVTVDGGELSVQDDLVRTRVRASTGTWVAVTIAVDGHLPADTQACLRTVGLDDRVGGMVGEPGFGCGPT